MELPQKDIVRVKRDFSKAACDFYGENFDCMNIYEQPLLVNFDSYSNDDVKCEDYEAMDENEANSGYGPVWTFV